MDKIEHVGECLSAICNGDTVSDKDLIDCLKYTEKLQEDNNNKHCKIMDLEEEIIELNAQLTGANKAVVKLVHKRI